MAVMEAKEILKMLPQRYPMLLVDRVIECDGKRRIVAIKNITINEPFLQGHFPGDPIMPGVLQLEAMAQVAGILMNQMFSSSGRVAYFLAVDNARFRRIIRPGDTMRMEIEFVRARMSMSKVHGKTFVGEELASEADLMFGWQED